MMKRRSSSAIGAPAFSEPGSPTSGFRIESPSALTSTSIRPNADRT